MIKMDFLSQGLSDCHDSGCTRGLPACIHSFYFPKCL